jgi:Flp pilus assembly pilin Flp
MRPTILWRHSALSRCVRRFTKDESGQDLIEYALLAGFVVIAIYVTLPSELMPAISTIFSKIGSTFSQTPG